MRIIVKLTQVLLATAFIFSSSAFADGQCGPFRLSAGPDDGWFRINGAKPESQKVTFLKDKEDYDNIKIDWRMATDQLEDGLVLSTSSATAKPFSTHSGCKPAWMRRVSMQHTTA